jgi:Pyruvate/2-oxoacid:ferredoxin oxidoreductase gamma subunit
MIGALAKIMKVSYDDIHNAVIDVVPAKALSVNEKALKAGFDYIEG